MNRLKGRLLIALVAMLPIVALNTLVMPEVASASGCAAGSGVTTVVGSTVRCASGGSRSAASAFSATGHSLTRVQRQPGFVCKVDGYPSSSCVNTPPTNAYWGLFWSDGKSGTWSYASVGVDSLKIPAGGWVGFAFQSGSGRTYPGATPRSAPAPTKPSASHAPITSGSSAGPKSGSTSSSPSPGSSGTKTPTPAGSSGSSASASSGSAEAGAKNSANKPAASSSSGSEGLGWVAAAVAVALLLGMWGTMWRRRQRPQ